MNPTRFPEDRQAVISRLHAALWALEHDDPAGWRSNVDALIQWRSQPLVQGLAKLARELEHALGDGAVASSGGSLPEACARLEHVVVRVAVGEPIDAQLVGVLDGDDPLVVRDLVDERAEQGRLARARAAGQHDVASGAHGRRQELRKCPVEHPATAQLIER